MLDNDVQGGGLERALIDRFLRDTQRGTNEQFATSFVLLARSLGIEARVATGFVAGGEDDATVSAAGDRVVLSSADADVWPEVQLGDGSWLAYDPVPAEEAADGAPPPPEPQVQTPAAPQPPIAPATGVGQRGDRRRPGHRRRVRRRPVDRAHLGRPRFGRARRDRPASARRGRGHRRREVPAAQKRLRVTDPAARIRGAWASATDALVDAGLNIRRSTDERGDRPLRHPGRSRRCGTAATARDAVERSHLRHATASRHPRRGRCLVPRFDRAVRRLDAHPMAAAALAPESALAAAGDAVSGHRLTA